MPTCCSVFGCKIRGGNNLGIRMIPFPLNEAKKTVWIKNIRRNRKDFLPTNGARVCGKHFVDGRPTEKNPYPTEILGDEINGSLSRTTALSSAAGMEFKKSRKALKKSPKKLSGSNGAINFFGGLSFH